jgi:hypothetical protein
MQSAKQTVCSTYLLVFKSVLEFLGYALKMTSAREVSSWKRFFPELLQKINEKLKLFTHI